MIQIQLILIKYKRNNLREIKLISLYIYIYIYKPIIYLKTKLIQ
jgi:hypothetical protein